MTSFGGVGMFFGERNRAATAAGRYPTSRLIRRGGGHLSYRLAGVGSGAVLAGISLLAKDQPRERQQHASNDHLELDHGATPPAGERQAGANGTSRRSPATLLHIEGFYRVSAGDSVTGITGVCTHLLDRGPRSCPGGETPQRSLGTIAG